MSRDYYRWRAPGNANIFDTDLKDWQNNDDKKFLSKRTIGVLKFIQLHNNCEKNFFHNNIREFLYKNYNNKENKSDIFSFYSPLIWLGFINYFKCKNDYCLSLSIDGKNFLQKIEDNNFDVAKNCLILQMLKTKYPNCGTHGVKLNLFPFRIIFKLLIEGKVKNKQYFNTKIPYIKNINDLYNLDNINGMNYGKWLQWELPWLEKFNILTINGNEVQISKKYIDYIKQFVDKMEYEDMFFTNNEEEINLKNSINKTIKRNNNIIIDVIQKNNYKCFFNHNHITFPNIKRPNYVEGHHIIPIHLQDSFPNNNLDVENNIISLCPNCHKAIHLANNEYKEQLLKQVYYKTNIKNDFNISLENLKEIYFSVRD